MQARLEEVEMGRDVDAKDVSEPKAEATEEAPPDVTPEMSFFRLVLRSTSKPRLEVSIYIGSLSHEEFIYWINNMEKFFDYEERDEGKKVKFAISKQNGHAAIWWDGVQAERRRLGKELIKNWNRMVAKLRGKFFPSDYRQTLFRLMRNLR